VASRTTLLERGNEAKFEETLVLRSCVVGPGLTGTEGVELEEQEAGVDAGTVLGPFS